MKLQTSGYGSLYALLDPNQRRTMRSLLWLVFELHAALCPAVEASGRKQVPSCDWSDEHV